jgi:hypothetical protein
VYIVDVPYVKALLKVEGVKNILIKYLTAIVLIIFSQN